MANERCYLCNIFFNTLRSRQNGRQFPDHIFKRIFLNQNVWTLINISLTFVPKYPINNIQALVQIMAWRHPGDKTLSETVLVSFLTHICVTRPQRHCLAIERKWVWVKLFVPTYINWLKIFCIAMLKVFLISVAYQMRWKVIKMAYFDD